MPKKAQALILNKSGERTQYLRMQEGKYSVSEKAGREGHKAGWEGAEADGKHDRVNNRASQLDRKNTIN